MITKPTDTTEVVESKKTLHEDPEALHSLLQVGINLTEIDDFPKMLDMILQEVRKLARAEAANLYVLEKGGKLHLVVAQNDRVASLHLSAELLNKEFPVTPDSLAGYVASVQQVINISNTYMLPPGTPFQMNRDFEETTGYRVKSAIGIPLRGPENRCVGVLELFNCIDQVGRIVAFDDDRSNLIYSLASIAAITIYNALLREELKRAHLDTIIRLSVAAEYRDNETAGHIRRVSHTSALIASEMGLTSKQVDVIHFASPMHDVGKIGIPDAVLHKPGKYTSDDRKIMEEHPVIAAEILGDPLNDIVDAARAVALTHHEKWNGQGYPSGLASEEIPLIGRIVGLADVFDALVSNRPYKEAYSLDRSLEIIREEEGKHFDPKVVKAFFNVLGDVLKFYHDPAVHDEAIGI